MAVTAKRRFIFSTLCFICAAQKQLCAQDLEQIVKGDIFSASGGISMQQVYYRSNALNPSRKPYTYLLSGNLNLNILGFIDAPFTFFYSNLGGGYTQPGFNQTSLHPKYKWIQTHFGDISSSWSPYTLNGHLYRGAAADFTFTKLQIALTYGRFLKGIRDTNMLNLDRALPRYDRFGGGLRLAYRPSQKFSIAFSIFSAKDKKETYSFAPAARNDAVSISAEISPLSYWKIKADFGGSAYTTDQGLVPRETNNPSAEWLQWNASTALYKAIKIASEFSIKSTLLNLGYERIDPGYKTMGAYYFNNDLESITVGSSTSFFANRLRVQGSLGKQRDNLNAEKSQNMLRTASSAGIQYQAAKKLSLSANHSGFLSYTNLRMLPDYQYQWYSGAATDTFNFRQISQNTNASMIWFFKQDTVQQNFFSANFCAQNSKENQGNAVAGNNLFLNGVISISRQHLKKGSNMSLSLNVSQYEMAGAKILNYGFAATASGSWAKKKGKTSLSIGLNQQNGGTVIYMRNQISYALQKAHQLSLGVMYLHRPLMKVAETKYLSDLTINLTYSANMLFLDLGRGR